MEKSYSEEYNVLAYYTLSHPDMAYFIHQHFVDAYQAQNADENTKPIGIIFSLVGLYLYLEENYTGKEVQNAHIELARSKKNWPEIELPLERGAINISNVLKASPGPERDRMIREWCRSVWDAYKSSHGVIRLLFNKYFMQA